MYLTYLCKIGQFSFFPLSANVIEENGANVFRSLFFFVFSWIVALFAVLYLLCYVGNEREELLFSFVGVDTRPEFLMMGICQPDDLRLGIRKKNEATALHLSHGSSDVSKTHFLLIRIGEKKGTSVIGSKTHFTILAADKSSGVSLSLGSQCVCTK